MAMVVGLGISAAVGGGVRDGEAPRDWLSWGWKFSGVWGRERARLAARADEEVDGETEDVMTLQQRRTSVGVANNDSDSDESILGAPMAWVFGERWKARRIYVCGVKYFYYYGVSGISF